MYHKIICVVLIALLLFYDIVDGKKARRTKRPKPEEETSAPQPEVVSYSTFGFNDVGTYEGFVPSSPDYARLLTNQESPTDPTGYSNSFGSSNPFDSQSFTVSDNGNSQPTLVKYPVTSNEPTYVPSSIHEENYGPNRDDPNSPVYGTKINSKSRGKPFYQLNSTEFTETKSTNPDENKNYFGFHETKSPFDNQPEPSELSKNYQQIPSYPSTSSADYGNAALGDNQSALKFPRVVDFTKFKSYYPELDTSQMPATPKPDLFESQNNPATNFYGNVNSDNSNKLFQSALSYKENYEPKKNDDAEKNVPKFNSYTGLENTYNNYNSDANKANIHGSKSSSDYKNKPRDKPWSAPNYDSNKWKEHFPTVKGYEFSTDFSNTSFRYDINEPKNTYPSNFDEIVSAESNLDLHSYQFPQTDYSSFKKMPSYKVHEEEEYDIKTNFKDTFKQNFDFEHKPTFKDTLKQSQDFDTKLTFKDTIKHNQDFDKFRTPTSSSYWGNVFPSSDFSSFKHHPTKNIFDNVANEDVVNIKPRRPSKWNYELNYHDNKPSEWSQFNRRPTKGRPWKDWTKQIPNRYQSEEDLLDIRNQDTSNPSYLPTHHSNNYVADESDYKKLVDKWRQSYLKSKHKDSLRDHEHYETKPVHVALPKPYPIEVPHPVIVPVPQLYPVRVPVARPVAVPVIQELKIPIEKPVPYPVIKKVPYPIEKLVPVPVEKEVAVPVPKPYPVHIPYVRPVFHHTKTRDEHESFRDDDDYFPRLEGSQKQTQYRKKKPQSPRDRVRRPSRTVYQDRNRRRWPDKRRPSKFPSEQPLREIRRPGYSPPSKHRDYEPEGIDEDTEYYVYCKKTGNC